MMYKGNKGLVLGVYGDLKFGNLDDEDSGNVMNEFFSALETQIHTDRIIFLKNIKTSVSSKILDKQKPVP